MNEDIGKPGQVKAFMIDGSVKWIDPPDNDFDRLLMRYQEEYEKHRWIPCAERMPEIDVDVLVFTGGPTMLLNSDRVAIGCWAGSDWETSLGVYNPPIISHWMPLPVGPEVKG